MPNVDAAIAVLKEFRNEIDAIYGLHVDSCSGFHFFRKQLEGQLAVAGPPPASERRIYFGKGDPNLPTSKYQHVATVQDVIERNAKEGSNERRLRQACIVFAYMLWEDHARDGFATELNMEKNEIKSPVFADLGKLRHGVAHNRGILAKEPEILTVIAKNSEIVLTQSEFGDLLRTLLCELERLALEYAGQVVEFPFDHR